MSNENKVTKRPEIEDIASDIMKVFHESKPDSFDEERCRIVKVLRDQIAVLKLPTDEEIRKGKLSMEYYTKAQESAFVDGAEWMRDQIQGK